MNVSKKMLVKSLISPTASHSLGLKTIERPPVFMNQSGILPCYSAVIQAYEFHEGKAVEQRLKTVQFQNVQMESNVHPAGINRLKV